MNEIQSVYSAFGRLYAAQKGDLYFFVMDRREKQHDTLQKLTNNLITGRAAICHSLTIKVLLMSHTTTTSHLPIAQLSPLVTSPHDLKSDLMEQAIELAERLLTSARQSQTTTEYQRSARLARMMHDEPGKALTLAMADQVFRSHDSSKAARRWRQLIDKYGIPSFLSSIDRWLMQTGVVASRFFPRSVMQMIEQRMQSESAEVIIPREKEQLRNYLAKRRSEGFRLNLNHLGEAVLGESEAAQRLEAILGYLADSTVDYVSVKISAIYSQISLIAWDSTVDEIKSRLRRLFREAAKAGKFVNLDMEEYRDLALTVAAFREVLDEPEFLTFSAGIVLQAYLPDTYQVQKELTEWSRSRVERGGVPIKIRLVKGANLAMEIVEAELHGWHPAPYATKAETDANFRRLLEFGCDPHNATVVRLGVASHNLFDIALALTLRAANRVEKLVEIEMLEGMANHQARAVREIAGGLLLYAPAVKREDFLSAMAYLVRRLDENTARDNFLRDMFAMQPGSEAWKTQRERFIRGWQERSTVSSVSRRLSSAIEPETSMIFQNEPDSDWTQPNTRDALQHALDKRHDVSLSEMPELETMLCEADKAQKNWEALGTKSRGEILRRAASVMRADRFSTIALLRDEGKKAVYDADIEVSEAIDFARYYAKADTIPLNVRAKSLGIVTVISPWNFPYAIPAGGILAALMAGNCVIFKPASTVKKIAFHLVNQLWSAGVPREVLHFFPCDGDTGKVMLTDRRIAACILTGSYETARKFQNWRPSLPLYAETSGKNAIIVTAQADRELAIKDIVRSAFGHSGQKCSAASLAILEAEVYDDPIFRRQLLDAASSLHVGPSDDPRSVVTPLVIEPGDKLKRAFTTLDEGESWLLQPRQLDNNPCNWSTGIKLGVKPGSWFHQTECFGPVLGLMRADSLQQATEWQNAVDFRLTAGLHSLDEEEMKWWQENVQAGNLYINRPITGAVVQRQPFGGWKKSCIGTGAKAGGPNYVHGFYHLSDTNAATPDYEQVWKEHFGVEHDPAALRCESNVFRYRPCRGVILRLDQDDDIAIERAEFASRITGTPLQVCLRSQESDEAFIARLPLLVKRAEFLRTVTQPDEKLLTAAYEAGLNWINAPLLASGRIELTRWLREQSISRTLHRYGHLAIDKESRHH